ncbi:MAG: site-specific integrase [Moorellales bacterium]
MSRKSTPPGVDDRLLKRRLVEKWLETCRRGEVNPRYVGRAVRRIYEEAGRVFLDILIRDLEAVHIRDRHLAAGCLLELPPAPEVRLGLREVVGDRRRHLWARGICLIALSGMGEPIEGIMQRYPELSEELPAVMARQYIDALCDEELSNGRGWNDFLRNPEEAQVEVINLLTDVDDVKVVDFLWWASEQGSPPVKEAARRALARMRLSGVDVDRNRQAREHEVSPLLAVKEGNAAMRQWRFARAIFYLTGALQKLSPTDERSFPVRLQLVTALLRDGQIKEALKQCEELAVVAGPDHFYGRKAEQLTRAIREVLACGQGGQEAVPLDPVEEAVHQLLAGCRVPSRSLDRALVIWDNFLRYTSDPVGQIDDPRIWAAAVLVCALLWLRPKAQKREELNRVIAGLPAVEVRQRAALIWNALGLGEDSRWLRREIAYLESLNRNGDPDEVSLTVEEYLAELGWGRSPSTVRRYREGLSLFREYLLVQADVATLEEITPEHLVEFLAYWYVGTEGIKRSVAKAKALLSTVLSFCQWLDRRKGTELVPPYYPLHQQLRRDLPRALTLASLLPGSTFAGPQRFEQQVSDYFRVESLAQRTMAVQGLQTRLQLRGVVIPPEGKELFRPDDILYLTLGKRKRRWYIIDAGAVFPPLAASFVGRD